MGGGYAWRRKMTMGFWCVNLRERDRLRHFNLFVIHFGVRLNSILLSLTLALALQCRPGCTVHTCNYTYTTGLGSSYGRECV